MTSTPAKRILIVEDNALNLELATEVLGVHGHIVLQAHTAEEGLRLVRSDRPDLILLDVRLPGMDGLAAVRDPEGGCANERDTNDRDDGAGDDR